MNLVFDHELSARNSFGPGIRYTILHDTQVLTWRGLNSLKDFKTPEGGVGLIPKALIGAAFLSMATASFMHFLHFRVSNAVLGLLKIIQHAK